MIHFGYVRVKKYVQADREGSILCHSPLGGRSQRGGEGIRGRQEKGKHRKGKRTKLAKGASTIEDTPRGAVANSLRLHLHSNYFLE